MKCRLLLIIGIWIFMQSAFAQDQMTFIEDKKTSNTLFMSFDYDNASTLNNKFLQKIAFGGIISQDIIDDNYNRLYTNRENLFGSTIDFNFGYKKEFTEIAGFKNIGFSTSLEWHQITDFSFSADAFSLIMDGNKQFAGKNADLSNTGFFNMQYSQIKAGVFKFNENNNTEFGFRIGLNLGNKFNDISTSNAQLFTDANGEEITLKGDLAYRQTDYLGDNFAKIQGLGVSLDLYYVRKEDKKYNYGAEVNNIGFMHWNKNSTTYKNTEDISFTGIDIDNIFDIPDDLFPSNIEDTLNNYIAENANNESFNILIPMTLNLWYEHFINKKFSAEAKFFHRMFTSYKPNYQLGANYYLNNDYKIGVNINYGGYGKLNIGISLGAEIRENLEFNIQTRYFSGIMAKQFSGLGGFAQIKYKF